MKFNACLLILHWTKLSTLPFTWLGFMYCKYIHVHALSAPFLIRYLVPGEAGMDSLGYVDNKFIFFIFTLD